LKLQRLQNKVLRTIGNFPRCTPVLDLHKAFNLPYVYDYTTKLCRQQAEVIQNHETDYVSGIGHGEARHRKYKRLNLGGGQVTTGQVTKLPLQYKVNKTGMICFEKPGLTGLVYIVKGRIFSIKLYVRYVHLTKAKRIHKRQTHRLVREDVTLGLRP
jgi:hypothetical protein